jgi:predicted ATPase
MTTKLTLSIEKKTIERAKRLSLKRGKSISKIVEEYLNTLTEKEEKKTSAVATLSGALKNKIPADMEWKEVKADYLKKKYGV